MKNFLKKLFNKQEVITTPLTITSSNGFHLRPIAKFVNEVKKYKASISLLANNKETSATQVPNILALSLEKEDTFVLKVQGEDAQKASEELTLFFKKLMQEDNEDNIKKQLEDEKEFYEAQAIKGSVISKGVAVAKTITYFKERIINNNAINLQEALSQTAKDLQKLYEAHKDKKEAEIFLAHQALLDSDVFQKEFHNIDQAIEELRGGRFESRMLDYQDLKKRIESHMGVETKFRLPDNQDYILLIGKEELLPSEVEALSKLSIKGVILSSGSTSSHVAILLRSFQIPSIIANKTINITNQNTLSLLDASSAQFIASPTPHDLEKAYAKIEKLKTEQNQAYEKRFEKLMTKENKAIKILANITNPTTAKEAQEQGADGIGLFRTEFLFTEKKPSIEEQTQAYEEVFELFDEVTIRTLDIGGDKSLPYIKMPKEDNPFLGIRGIRFSLQELSLFKEQLLAIFEAVKKSHTNNKTIKIMFPMVSTTQEFSQAKNIAQAVAKEHNLDISNIQFGIMLEVPSVIFALKEFNNLVDFYSIGSNDLTQYLFAIERTHPTLSVDLSSPVLMETLKYIKSNTNKPISICGELAGLEKISSELINIGYLNLSISPKIIPSLKNNINIKLHG